MFKLIRLDKKEILLELKRRVKLIIGKTKK
jgi:hypothetical protein